MLSLASTFVHFFRTWLIFLLSGRQSYRILHVSVQGLVVSGFRKCFLMMRLSKSNERRLGVRMVTLGMTVPWKARALNSEARGINHVWRFHFKCLLSEQPRLRELPSKMARRVIKTYLLFGWFYFSAAMKMDLDRATEKFSANSKFNINDIILLSRYRKLRVFACVFIFSVVPIALSIKDAKQQCILLIFQPTFRFRQKLSMKSGITGIRAALRQSCSKFFF